MIFETNNFFLGEALPVPPAGKHTDGHRANAKRFTQVEWEGYTLVRKHLPGPGAQNYAFDSLALAESTAIGPAIAQRSFWKTIMQPLFVNNLTRPTSGYGGVAQGQLLSQPLFDPYNNSYGAIPGN